MTIATLDEMMRVEIKAKSPRQQTQRRDGGSKQDNSEKTSPPGFAIYASVHDPLQSKYGGRDEFIAYLGFHKDTIEKDAAIKLFLKKIDSAIDEVKESVLAMGEEISPDAKLYYPYNFLVVDGEKTDVLFAKFSRYATFKGKDGKVKVVRIPVNYASGVEQASNNVIPNRSIVSYKYKMMKWWSAQYGGGVKLQLYGANVKKLADIDGEGDNKQLKTTLYSKSFAEILEGEEHVNQQDEESSDIVVEKDADVPF